MGYEWGTVRKSTWDKQYERYPTEGGLREEDKSAAADGGRRRLRQIVRLEEQLHETEN